MSIAHHIREIGRGAAGARSLDREQALDLMRQVLDRQVTDLEIGAFALAMRVKGESLDELIGFLDATHERCAPLPEAGAPVVLLPSYNGARRLPNLTPLLALRLAQEGLKVVVHGPLQDPARVTTADVFHSLGLAIARQVEEAEQAWSRQEPAFVRTDLMCPPLAALLDVRRVVGVRNSGHTVAKMLKPLAGRALRVVNHTHPEFGELMRQYAAATHADMLLLRGTEGEPVADPRRQPRMDVVIGGLRREDLSLAPQEGVLAELPVLPRQHDATTTALYIQSVLSGEKPAPGPLEQQVQAIVAAVRAIERGEALKERTA
ncbi:DNA-binding protein YbiB [Aquabacterium sp. J223]|uniref:DNA-binding protein YbiB n=1 Tax=Aquabacterium sp. J223 TaxID=2898431 RepID=UPI0021AE2101|nr:DNA-binding protein YbiB [Aquabacterium sp. J223]UUX97633.1 DNA-binding protein YbiB [Aquabacterium sp. J223]